MGHLDFMISEAGKMAVFEEAGTGLDSDKRAAADYTLATWKVHCKFQLKVPGMSAVD